MGLIEPVADVGGDRVMCNGFAEDVNIHLHKTDGFVPTTSIAINFTYAFMSYIIYGMERIVNKSNSFKKAEEWDMKQYKSMTPEQRLYIAKILKERFYGKDCLDVREAENKKT